MKDKLKEIMSRVFEVSLNEINEDVSQSSLDKWDSLNQLNLVVELEDAFDILFEPEEIGQMIDFESVMRIVSSKKND